MQGPPPAPNRASLTARDKEYKNKRKSGSRYSTLRKNWLKFQQEKRRYHIGFPVGFGSFSVVYFAKAHQSATADPTQSAHIRAMLSQRAKVEERDMALPDFVAVKVISLSNEINAQPTQPKRRLSCVNELHTPKETQTNMFKIQPVANHIAKAADIELVNGRKADLHGVFDMELNNFLLRHFNLHFSAAEAPKPSKPLARLDTLDDEESLDEILEVRHQAETGGKKSSWLTKQLPKFFNTPRGEGDTLPKLDLDLDFDVELDLDLGDLELKPFIEKPVDLDFLVESSHDPPSKPVIESPSTDLTFLAEVTAIHRDKARLKNLHVQRNLQQLHNIRPLSRNNSRHSRGSGQNSRLRQTKKFMDFQTNSIMTEIPLEQANVPEQIQVPGSPTGNFINRKMKQQTDKMAKTKFHLGTKEEKIQKTQSIESISLEIQALAVMRDCQFAIFLFDVLQTQNDVRIVTEFAHIGCLDTFCEDSFPEGVPETVVKWLIAPIMLAIKHLNKHKMIHRDIKPSNIVINRAGVPKLCDFGMVKRIEESATTKTQGFCGTELFAPPEAFGRDRNYGVNFDSWSLGLTILSLVYANPNPWLHSYTKKEIPKDGPKSKLKIKNKDKKHKQCIKYIGEKLEEEVSWLKQRKELARLAKENAAKIDASEEKKSSIRRDRRNAKIQPMEAEYVGVYKRLSLLEKGDIDNPSIEETLLLMYYRDVQHAMALKRKKSFHSESTKGSDAKSQEKKFLKKLNSADFGKGKGLGKGEELRGKLVKGMVQFNRERRQLVKFVKRCVRVIEERPIMSELVQDRYFSKMIKSWEKFDEKIETKLMEIALTGEFSCIEKSDFGGPYFNVRGEFIAAGKQVAMNVHKRFGKS